MDDAARSMKRVQELDSGRQWAVEGYRWTDESRVVVTIRF